LLHFFLKNPAIGSSALAEDPGTLNLCAVAGAITGAGGAGAGGAGAGCIYY